MVYTQTLALGELLAAELPPPLDLGVGYLIPTFADAVARAAIREGGC